VLGAFGIVITNLEFGVGFIVETRHAVGERVTADKNKTKVHDLKRLQEPAPDVEEKGTL
jgi:hypothetical protein